MIIALSIDILLRKCQYIIFLNDQVSICVNFPWVLVSNLGDDEWDLSHLKRESYGL